MQATFRHRIRFLRREMGFRGETALAALLAAFPDRDFDREPTDNCLEVLFRLPPQELPNLALMGVTSGLF